MDSDSILNDYRLICESRAASVLARKEVLAGRAKFGIFGDGKEVAQVAMAKVFQTGDFRSGYYRDQTFMMAIGALTIQQYFAQLYAHPNPKAEPASGGRMMNSHFATRFIDDAGEWLPLQRLKNAAADVSCTGSQMPRLLGLAYASKLYRHNPKLAGWTNFSDRGNEIAFGTIGDAATSEGMFFETLNAAGVLQVPLLVSVWDDAYGISVGAAYHTTRRSISKALAGFQRTATEAGLAIFEVDGWNYAQLCCVYRKAADLCRKDHVPVLVHVKALTQPQGHSTSGSHERYKSADRLSWEAEYDCNRQMRRWLLDSHLASSKTLDHVEQTARDAAQDALRAAWRAHQSDTSVAHAQVVQLLEKVCVGQKSQVDVAVITDALRCAQPLTRSALTQAVEHALYALRDAPYLLKKPLLAWRHRYRLQNRHTFNTHLYSSSKRAAMRVPHVQPTFSTDAPRIEGYRILQACFDHLLEQHPSCFVLGQDVGVLGGVNQGLAGLQKKHGVLRVTDTSIRECTMLGQGIGAAMRGLRPIVEIQYLDYLPYALQIISDDLATLRYRTCGGQQAPVIVRTRGHRLEGMWHSGSYLASVIHSVRGVYVLVPRDMVRAAGFYNTMMRSDDPAIIIECLNGYRLKERFPNNLKDFTLPLGLPEVLRSGKDITLVTYGAMCRLALEAAEILEEMEIDCEVIDVQSLLPFDRRGVIAASLQRTRRIVFADEDVPGGTTAYMMQCVLETQRGYPHLDTAPATLSSQPHRPAYGDDGNYFSKPNVETLVEKIYSVMQDALPAKYPPMM